MTVRPEKAGEWLSASLPGLALTSFLSDAGHELATAVLPMYVASIGLGTAALGAIEGLADLASGLAKLGGGAGAGAATQEGGDRALLRRPGDRDRGHGKRPGAGGRGGPADRRPDEGAHEQAPLRFLRN